MTAGAAISTNTATPSATGPNSPSNACLPAVPLPWAYAATAAPCRAATYPARLRLAAHHVHHAAPAVAVLQQQLAAAERPVSLRHSRHAPLGASTGDLSRYLLCAPYLREHEKVWGNHHQILSADDRITDMTLLLFHQQLCHENLHD
nr:hypothetical protein Man4p_00034 [Serratia proteamaculans]